MLFLHISDGIGGNDNDNLLSSVTELMSRIGFLRLFISLYTYMLGLKLYYNRIGQLKMYLV